MRLGVSNGFLPNKAAVLKIDAGNDESKSPFGIDVVVGPGGLLGNGKRIPLRNGAGQENLFSPNYRAGMSLIGEGEFPADVFGLVPVERGIGMRCFPGCEGSSPLVPKVERFSLALRVIGFRRNAFCRVRRPFICNYGRRLFAPG